MTPRTISQNELIRKQKSEHIMCIALELFAENGYHATSVSDIAKKAGISKGLLYNYFEGKDKLLESIISDGFVRIISSFNQTNENIITRNELIDFISNVLEMMQNDKLFWRLYMSLLIQPAVHSTEIINGYKDKADYIFTLLTNYFIEKGSKNPLADTTMLHMVMDGIFFNYLYDEEFPVDEIKQMIIDRFV